jgi:hypothetical protein
VVQLSQVQGPAAAPLAHSWGGHSVGPDDRPMSRLREGSHRAARLRWTDSISNLQWQTVAAAKAKDRWERKGCSR